MDLQLKMEPIIKWAGGKRRFVNQIIGIIGNKCDTYFEPFLGGGAILYRINAEKYICSDVNEELINFYNVVKNDITLLIDIVEKEFVSDHSKDFYLKIRKMDREKNYLKNNNNIYRAARFLYLNKTCFNGLWRVNSHGQNNVPMGDYKKPNILDKDNLRNASIFFNSNDITFLNCSFEDCVSSAKAGDLVYFDPPYDVEDGQNSFTEYSKSGFNRDSQTKLKELCDKLILKKVKVAISNSDTEFIRKLYLGSKYVTYTIYNKIISNRTIGATPDSRKKVTELLIIGELKNEQAITTGE